MNQDLQNLEIKVENNGVTPQGRVSAAEWNIVVSALKDLDLGSGGGVADSVAWSNITSKPDWIGASKPSYTYSEILETPDFGGFVTTESLTELLSGKADKATKLAEYGITDAYTKDELNVEFEKYMLKDTAQPITAQHNFTNGLLIDGLAIKKSADKTFYFDGNLVVSGVITMFGKDSTTFPTIWANIPFNPNHMTWDGSQWSVVGGGGGASVTKDAVIEALGYTPLDKQGVAFDSNKFGGLSVADFARVKQQATDFDANNMPDGVWGGKLFGSPNWALDYYAYLSVGSGNYKMQFNGVSNRLTYRAGNESGIENKDWVEILSSANYYDYALPITGGTVKGETTFNGNSKSIQPLTVATPSMGYTGLIRFTNGGSVTMGYIGFQGVGNPVYNDTSNYYPLIHSGNVESYNAGSATKLETPRTIWGQSFDGTEDIVGNLMLYKTLPTGGWARQVYVAGVDGRTLGSIGLYGNGDSLAYVYIGTEYNNRWMSIYPTGDATFSGKVSVADMLYIYPDRGGYAGSYYIMDKNTGEAYHLSARGGEDKQFRLYYTPDQSTYVSLIDITKTGNVHVRGNLQANGIFIQKVQNQWLNTANLQLGRLDMTPYSDRACIGVTDGNLHLDAYRGKGIYLNYYQTGDVGGYERAVAIFDNGNVSIGGPMSYEKLHVYGNILATGTITFFSQASLKNVINHEGLSLDELAKIRPARFKWKDGRDGRVHVGVIAENILPILPEVVYFTGEEKTKTVDYSSLATHIGVSLIKPVVNHEKWLIKHDVTIAALNAKVQYLESKLKQYNIA